MESPSSHIPPLTPEQLAAVSAGRGFAEVEDPNTHRVYMLVERSETPAIDDEVVRSRVAEGISQADRGEATDWDPDALKAELRKRFSDRNR